MAFRNKTGLNIWPAFADLLGGLLLIVFALSRPQYLKKLTIELNKSKVQIKHLSGKNEELKKENLELIKKWDEARKRIGVSKQFVEKLASKLKGHGINGVRILRSGTLEIPESILFNSGQAHIQSRFRTRVRTIGMALSELLAQPKYQHGLAFVLIIGNADHVGSDDTNLLLGSDRAMSVFRAIEQEVKNSKNLTRAQKRCILGHIIPSTAGEFRPKVIEGNGSCNNNPGETGCRVNRRIEIKIIPKSENEMEIPGCASK